MEVLIEALIEIFGQLFGEIFFQAIASIFAHFAKYINANNSVRKFLKYFISVLIFGSALIILSFAIMQKQDLYIQTILIYFFILVLSNITKFIIQNKDGNPKLMVWVIRFIHLIFPIVLIVISVLNPDETSKYIIYISVLTLIIYFFIYCYRIYNFTNKRRIKKASR